MSALQHRNRQRTRRAVSTMAWYHRSRRRATWWEFCPCGHEAWGRSGDRPDHWCA